MLPYKYTKDHDVLPVCTPVAVQNQTGRNPTKWDKTGMVVENKPHSQVLVGVDGSSKNRKYVKQVIPRVSQHPTTPPRVPAQAQVL